MTAGRRSPGRGRGGPATDEFAVPDGRSFALCLTHDVDRPYKRAVHAVYYALAERSPRHLRGILPPHNPYWQFETVTSIERARGVRSAFYFLDEPHVLRRGPRALASPRAWIEQAGRYDVTAPAIADVVRRLDDGGWEVGLHGSIASAGDAGRLAAEKSVLEGVLGGDVVGCRQHRLRLDVPDTWYDQRGVGLRYDASLGSGTEAGFHHGYDPIRPFDDGFVVFPLTVMEQALPDPGREPEAAWDVCRELLVEAEANGAVMTVLWHPRCFSDRDFPGYRELYERLLDEALEMGAWVGPPGDLYEYQERERPVSAR